MAEHMCWMYILKNYKGKYYIGSTNNLARRLKEHKQGKTRTTRVFNIHTLIYSEEFDTIFEARTREKKLKSYKSKKYIDWLIQQGR